MLDAHARRGFPDWLTVAATCRAVFAEAQLPKLRHARLSHDRRHLRLPADLRTTAKQDKVKTGMAQVDPQMAKVVSLCKRRDGKLLPVTEQSRQWLALRDQIASANYDLAYSAARKQAARNLHLAREIVPCVFCPGSSCTRCRGSGRYKAQPDLERLAYAGLLEAIWRFDTAKAHCLSSFAVHLMKQSMMTLLRQTPVHFPQDLLRDRREIVAESRRLTKAVAEALKVQIGRKLTEDEQAGCARECSDDAAAELLHQRERELFAKRKGREPTAQEAEALRAKHERSVAERVQLAKGCYYGQERKSVEDLQERYVSRSTRREGSPRLRPSRAQSIVEALSSAPSPGVQTQRVEAFPGIADAEQAEELRDALGTLTAEQRAEVQRFLRGRGQISEATREVLREQMAN